jgi:hypothetical protein
MPYLCLEKGLQEEILARGQRILSGLHERPYYQEQRKGTIRKKETGTEQEETTKNTFYLIIWVKDLFLEFSCNLGLTYVREPGSYISVDFSGFIAFESNHNTLNY